MNDKKKEVGTRGIWHFRDLMIKIVIILIVVEVLLGIGYGIANYMDALQVVKAIMLRVLVAGIFAVVGLCLIAGNLKESVTKIVAQKFFAILAVITNAIWVVLWIGEVMIGGGVVIGCHEVPYQCNAAPGEMCLMITSKQVCGLTVLGWVAVAAMIVGVIVSLVLWIMAKVQYRQRKKEYYSK